MITYLYKEIKRNVFLFLLLFWKHQENVRKNDPIALFVEKQKIVKEIYERFRESTGLLKVEDEKKEYE